tara:strand:- start:299 stop:499 length:201 start_codon:yes stop_codon:yes gene_type:complete
MKKLTHTYGGSLSKIVKKNLLDTRIELHGILNVEIVLNGKSSFGGVGVQNIKAAGIQKLLNLEMYK